jgi:hypothetical protein
VIVEQAITAIVAVVENQVAGGAHWGRAGEEIACVAVKRWKIYFKRHPKAKRISDWERIADLVKGFEAKFESGERPWNIPPGEWKWLAEQLLPILQGQEV